MVWIPVNKSAVCIDHPKLLSCQASLLAFFTFVTQNFNHSIDDKLTDVGKTVQVDSEYDFIIVGAGSAGCVLANRLSEIEDWKVLLLEAGEEEPLAADVPGFTAFLSGSNIDWGYKTQPEPVICKSYGTSCSLPRGKVMGGTSTINYMGYVRGNKQDYDDWASFGNWEWSYDKVLPYFKKLEDVRIKELTQNTNIRGTGGYQTIDYFPYYDKEVDLLIDAWAEVGYEKVDYNAHRQLGAARMQLTTLHGTRQSTNGAYLRPIRGERPNLTIETQTYVTKIIIHPFTKRAIGVEYTSVKSKSKKRVFATKEVIVSAGAYDSAKLLLLSGIGPTDELKEANIHQYQNLPVGRNLHNHIGVESFKLHLTKEMSRVTTGENITNDAVYWLNTHKGLLSAESLQIAVFSQTKFEKQPGVPDVQYGHTPFLVEDFKNDPTGAGRINYYPLMYFSGISTRGFILNPKSRGFVKLNKTDPINSPPLIQLNGLTVSEDLEILVDAALHSRKLLDTKILKQFGFESFNWTIAACKDFAPDTIEYTRCLVEKTSYPQNHPVGTCKMGPKNDPTTVVDSRLRVHGIKGLRVIDASIMPVITRGNTNGPIIMIAEKGSDMIKQDWLKIDN